MEKPVHIWSDSLIIDAREIAAAILDENGLTLTMKGNGQSIRFGHEATAKDLMRSINAAMERIRDGSAEDI